MSDMLALMEKFRLSYATLNEQGLRETTSEDFEWHQHVTTNSDDMPTGRVLRGIDALIKDLKWRQANWRNVRYEDLEERAAPDMLVQTFRISGEVDEASFHAKAVDLYTVKDGLITLKDTYWKYLQS